MGSELKKMCDAQNFQVLYVKKKSDQDMLSKGAYSTGTGPTQEQDHKDNTNTS